MLLERLECVQISIGYGDFLSETLRHNLHIFDRLIVVTSEKDEVTREACRKHSVQTILSEEGNNKSGDGGSFNKGKLIERGLSLLSAEGFRVHLDSDMVLPSRTRHFLEISDLDTTKIYGIDRVMCKSYEDWKKLEASHWFTNGHHDFHNRLRWPEGYEVGSRWVDYNQSYCPIGAFQMWYSSQDQYKGSRLRPYPTLHNSAARADVQFSLLWDRNKRELLPDIVAVHLESQKSPLGHNWLGRKSKPFGPITKPNPHTTGCS